LILEQQIVAQVVKKIPSFYESIRFIALFRRARRNKQIMKGKEERESGEPE
jgi:hypothetical protein